MSHARITRDPAILMGKPCIQGTRISVEVIMRRFAAGLSADEIAAEYPELTRDDVLAAAAYAADLLTAWLRPNRTCVCFSTPTCRLPSPPNCANSDMMRSTSAMC